MNQTVFSTPFGCLKIGEESGKICFLRFVPEGEEKIGSSPLLCRATELLSAYFAGKNPVFDLPLLLPETPFAAKVVRQMRQIPYGQTVTYGRLAEACGCPGGARAVGNVCRTNPLPILIPCHRVLPSSGGIGAYSAGVPGGLYGPALKQSLLRLENPFFIG